MNTCKKIAVKDITEYYKKLGVSNTEYVGHQELYNVDQTELNRRLGIHKVNHYGGNDFKNPRFVIMENLEKEEKYKENYLDFNYALSFLKIKSDELLNLLNNELISYYRPVENGNFFFSLQDLNSYLTNKDLIQKYWTEESQRIYIRKHFKQIV